jgi:hypothetical protein
MQKRELDPHAWMNNGMGKIFTAGGTLKVPLTVAQKSADWIFEFGVYRTPVKRWRRENHESC